MKHTFSTSMRVDENQPAKSIKAVYDGAHPSASSSSKAGVFKTIVRVSVSSESGHLRATFNPVSADRDRRMAQLNQSVRLGYRPAKASTK